MYYSWLYLFKPCKRFNQNVPLTNTAWGVGGVRKKKKKKPEQMPRQKKKNEKKKNPKVLIFLTESI